MKNSDLNFNVRSGHSQDSQPRHLSTLPFVLAKQYSRESILKILNFEPVPRGGAWFTGHVEHEGNHFIFCNVGTPGRTGINHGNHFSGERLVWFSKATSKLKNKSFQRLLNAECRTYIFYRFRDRGLFMFAGIARPHQVFDTVPVKVIWGFISLPSIDAEKTVGQHQLGSVVEGQVRTRSSKIYERDRGARLECINHWGWQCHVCKFDFATVYGDLGEGFIHVHHLRPLGEIGEAHILDPVTDLRPVCPNCHAMLHRCIPALSIEALKSRILKTGNK